MSDKDVIKKTAGRLKKQERLLDTINSIKQMRNPCKKKHAKLATSHDFIQIPHQYSKKIINGKISFY